MQTAGYASSKQTLPWLRPKGEIDFRRLYCITEVLRHICVVAGLHRPKLDNRSIIARRLMRRRVRPRGRRPYATQGSNGSLIQSQMIFILGGPPRPLTIKQAAALPGHLLPDLSGAWQRPQLEPGVSWHTCGRACPLMRLRPRGMHYAWAIFIIKGHLKGNQETRISSVLRNGSVY